MEAKKALLLVFGLLLALGGLGYLVDLVRGSADRRRMVGATITLVTLVALTLCVLEPEVWPIFVLCLPSSASVVAEALLHLSDGDGMTGPAPRHSCR